MKDSIHGDFLRRLIGSTIEIIGLVCGEADSDVKASANSRLVELLGDKQYVEVREFLFLVEFSISQACNISDKKHRSPDIRQTVLERVQAKVDENTKKAMAGILANDGYLEYCNSRIMEMVNRDRPEKTTPSC